MGRAASPAAIACRSWATPAGLRGGAVGPEREGDGRGASVTGAGLECERELASNQEDST